jgi:hypothetical protein
MRHRMFLVAIAVASAACDRQPEPALADRAARAHAGDPETKGFWVGADGELAELARIGLIEFRPAVDRMSFRTSPRKIVLSDEAKALGLKVEIPDPDWPFGPSGVRAEGLCEEGFGAVTGIVPLEGGPLPAATVSYTRRHTGHSPLFQRLAAADANVDARRWCDPAATDARTLILVKRDTGWVPNRPPVVSASLRSQTKYDYDRAGRRVGAITRVELTEATIGDPDGDSVEVVGWLAEQYWPDDANRRLDARVEDKLVVDGTTATLTHYIFMGERSGAVLRYRVKDPWQEGGFRACVEGYLFGCR